ncbi:siderophore biosynthesis protein [Nostoc sp. TCL26-01]|uniref:siderophore biosynthesis protein n=1 Tax=Nostoc sp. TCL26-01 TaxID=2576904 RepID=UPI0015B9C163|nr:siderophore biosynthesis protein [Nostoc sp. TCL26-01]QLE54761.1 siderophore biosynthesis protein [Nostoc sp. TCL26-01]
MNNFHGEAQQIWKVFHWSFFINTQGLIICLNRLEMKLAVGNISAAQIELETAAELMMASGAAMELAGSFSRQEYESQVRPSMTPPYVQSADFSGLMSWEHSWLVKIWKRLRPVFERLPADLEPQHHQLVSAYFSLAKSHKAVCEKFGGGESGSLRCDKNTAVDILDRFSQNRWRLIDPNFKISDGCPFH